MQIRTDLVGLELFSWIDADLVDLDRQLLDRWLL